MTLSDARALVVAVALAVVAPALAVGAAPASGVGSATGASPTGVGSCTTIDRPGTYVLTKDIENGGKTRISGTCIEITADGVTFDGNGHTIDGRGVSHTKAVEVVGAKNVTVRNVEVGDWHEGVLVKNGSATIESVRSFSNAYGVRLTNASGSSVVNSTVEENLVGIYVESENVTLERNDLSGNEITVKEGKASGMRRPPVRVHPVTGQP